MLKIVRQPTYVGCDVQSALFMLLRILRILPPACLAVAVIALARTSSLAANPDPAAPKAVTTYECAGLYWKTGDAGACGVRYRPKAGGEWRAGLELVYDARDGEYRG